MEKIDDYFREALNARNPKEYKKEFDAEEHCTARVYNFWGFQKIDEIRE